MTKILITIDVEGGGPGQATYEPVNILATVLDELEIKTTLFITPDVIENRPETVRSWETSGHTLGLHIHPARFEQGESDLLTEYPQEEIEYFLRRSSDVFETYLGTTPTIFRAGKWEYSDALLRALSNHDFEIDASLRPPDNIQPYTAFGVTEVPVTVYSNPLVRFLLRNYSIEAVPLHADGFLFSPLTRIPFYTITAWLVYSSSDYVMMSFHDYDIYKPTQRELIRKYTKLLSKSASPTTIDQIV